MREVIVRIRSSMRMTDTTGVTKMHGTGTAEDPIIISDDESDDDG